MAASVAAFTPSRYRSTLFDAPLVALPEGVQSLLSSLSSLLNLFHTNNFEPPSCFASSGKGRVRKVGW